MGGTNWDDAAVEKLKQLYANGHSSSEMAALIGGGLTRNAVIGKVRRLIHAGHLAERPELVPTSAGRQRREAPGLAHVELIRKLASCGKTDSLIAAELGLKPDDVRYARRLEGIASSALPPVSPAMQKADEIARLAGGGQTDAMIGEQLSLTPAQVRWVRRQKGIAGNAPKPAAKKEASEPSDPAGHQRWFAEGYRGQRGRVDLMGLRDGMCKFPIDQAEGPVRFCGDDVVEGSSWCAHHAARCCAGAPAPKSALKPSHVYSSRRAA